MSGRESFTRASSRLAAVRGVLASVLGMIKEGAAPHIAGATDHLIDCFRNELWPGYKASAGVETDLLAQFPLLEEVLSTAGIVVWPMVEFEGTMLSQPGRLQPLRIDA
jgi:hypothetical protein